MSKLLENDNVVLELKRIALVGNPNTGKTSLFNRLTGLNQKVGNYAGVTVDKKTGHTRLASGKRIEVVDLPGTYSLYPRSADEKIVYEVLSDKNHSAHPDAVVVVADASNLQRHLMLLTQVLDLGLPAVLVLNMMDVAESEGIEIDPEKLGEFLGGLPVCSTNAREGDGLNTLYAALESFSKGFTPPPTYLPLQAWLGKSTKAELLVQLPTNGAIYKAAQAWLQERPQAADYATFEKLAEREGYVREALQAKEAELRYEKITNMLKFVVRKKTTQGSHRKFTQKLDKIILHPVGGYAVFLGVMFLIFQAIFAWASWPMDLIDGAFAEVSSLIKNSLPAGVFTDLLAEGVVPGIGGVAIFVPQIALLFGFLALLEESGYMSRVVFLMDRLMRPFGLSGRSVVPLISGMACAVPAIMATRTIDDWKDRLLTIFVTPFMSCSARLPVYTTLIALVIPQEMLFGFFNLQGAVLLGLYLLGIVAALVTALVMKGFVRTQEKGFLLLELPTYKMPRWENVLLLVWEKARVFLWEAGRIVFAISIILWVGASYGPGDAQQEAISAIPAQTLSTEDYEKAVANAKLSNSYIGYLGQVIQPVIKPLGYDWKIGIALVASFAAREVFVGTLATLYSVGEEDEGPLLARMQQATWPDGSPIYTLATGLSLMVFYAFAMQCMSTLAVVVRETKSWKWAAWQALYMTALAYAAAGLVYQVLS